jgi:ribonuclease HI
MQNSDGIFVATGTNKCMHNFIATEGEAMAILEAMCEEIYRGWTNIVFDGDSKVVVDVIQATL